MRQPPAQSVEEVHQIAAQATVASLQMRAWGWIVAGLVLILFSSSFLTLTFSGGFMQLFGLGITVLAVALIVVGAKTAVEARELKERLRASSRVLLPPQPFFPYPEDEAPSPETDKD